MSRPTKTIVTVALLLAASLGGCSSENSAPAGVSAGGATDSAPAAQPAPADDNNTASQLQGGWQPTNRESLQCQLDIVSGQPATPQVNVRREAGVALEGWVFENGQPQIAKLSVILVQGTDAYAAKANGGLARPDVAQAFGIPELGNTGFSTMTDLINVPAGQYALWVANGSSATDKACDLKVILNLED